jgi:hypothetical protein
VSQEQEADAEMGYEHVFVSTFLVSDRRRVLRQLCHNFVHVARLTPLLPFDPFDKF